MQRVLLANEAGTGRGHVTTLKVFAQALGPGFTYDAALCRMHYAGDLAPLCEQVFPGAALHYQPDVMARRAGRPIGNWAEFLAAIGFANEVFLERQVAWWIATIKARCSDLVVAEFAPCAMLAARALGIPAISIGQGHSTPPAGMTHFPLPEQGAAGLVHEEAELVDIVNRVGARLGVPALRRFSDIYLCAAQLPRTIPALDPYADWRQSPTYLPPMGLDCPRAADGDEVFVYLSGKEATEPAIGEALCSLDLPLRVVMPEIDPDLADRLDARGVFVEPAPLPHELIAQRSRMIVHAGQHGATCLGLALGLPQVALPGHSEQLANAGRIAAMGALVQLVRPRDDHRAIAATIQQAYADASMARRASDLSQQLRADLVGDTPAILRRIVHAILDHGVAA